MISIIAFIIVMFGSLNWLCIGFFQYDLVAGLFGYQGSIFSRIVYIIVGICAIYLIFVMIKNKGRLTVKKLKKQEQPMVDKILKKPEEQIERDEQIAQNIKYESEHHHDPQVSNQIEQNNQNIANQTQNTQTYVTTNPNYQTQTNNQTQNFANENINTTNQPVSPNNLQVDTQNLNNQHIEQKKQ